MPEKQPEPKWERVQKDLGKLVEHVNSPSPRSNPPPQSPTPTPKKSPDNGSKAG